MSDRPDLNELVGEELEPEERARLERVHELLVAAGPPPELPPRLAEPGGPPREEANVSFLPRRRAGLLLGLAAALALVAFVGGFVAGRSKGSFSTFATVRMHGTALASNASATIRIGRADGDGNWPLKLDAHGLKPLPQGQYYEMYLTRGGKPIASCGTFRLASGESPPLNAPYNLRRFDGWIVRIEGRGAQRRPVVLTTGKA